jgi:hypothetical protein
VDDVNDMNESPGIVEQVLQSSIKRRDFLTKAAAAGAITWATPVILSRAADAAEVAGGTPKCRPTITPACQLVSCNQGNKNFPGFTISTGGNCPCSTHPAPFTCIKITNLSNCGSMSLVAYGNGTDCSPNGTTNVLTNATGSWVCFDASQPVFFGPPRNSQGAINNLSTCSFTFDLAVWAGCPNSTGSGFAFDCRTYHVTISYTSGNNASATCTFDNTAPATACTGVTTPPCTCP